MKDGGLFLLVKNGNVAKGDFVYLHEPRMIIVVMTGADDHNKS
jgi:hypothetical protein